MLTVPNIRQSGVRHHGRSGRCRYRRRTEATRLVGEDEADIKTGKHLGQLTDRPCTDRQDRGRRLRVVQTPERRRASWKSSRCTTFEASRRAASGRSWVNGRSKPAARAGWLSTSPIPTCCRRGKLGYRSRSVFKLQRNQRARSAAETGHDGRRSGCRTGRLVPDSGGHCSASTAGMIALDILPMEPIDGRRIHPAATSARTSVLTQLASVDAARNRSILFYPTWPPISLESTWRMQASSIYLVRIWRWILLRSNGSSRAVAILLTKGVSG